MGDAKFFRCGKCGYEFLSKTPTPTCPRCKNQALEQKDMKSLLGFDK